MNIKEIGMQDPLYDQTLALRTAVISAPFGFPAPEKGREEPDSHMFVAVDRGEVIGFAMITPKNTSIHVRQVCVWPARQKQGIGQQLMQKAEQVAKKLGYDELLLFAHTEAYPFYIKLKYLPRGDWMKAENGLRTILMGKRL